MSSTVNSLGGTTSPRILSPKSRSSEPFKGHFVVLDSPNNAASCQEKYNEEKIKRTKRPPSGSLEILNSETQNSKSASGAGSRIADKMDSTSVRKEKKLPGVKQKEECLCQNDTICKMCLQLKMQDLNLHGSKIKTSGMGILESKAEHLPIDRISLAANPTTPDGLNLNEEDDTSSSDESNDDLGGNSNGNNSQSLPVGSNAKAPLELLGRFLSALMKKEYAEAQGLCSEILQIEPNNSTCLEFKGTLKEKLEQDLEESSEEDEGDSSEEGADDDSDDEEPSEDEQESDSDEEIDVTNLNLLMGGVPVRR
eukprot:gene3654-4171_t